MVKKGRKSKRVLKQNMKKPKEEKTKLEPDVKPLCRCRFKQESPKTKMIRRMKPVKKEPVPAAAHSSNSTSTSASSTDIAPPASSPSEPPRSRVTWAEPVATNPADMKKPSKEAEKVTSADADVSEDNNSIQLTSAEKKRLWMEAERDRLTNENVPKELKKRWRKASNKERNSLFALWIQADKDWASVLLLEQVVRESRVAGQTKESWMTRRQILGHYTTATRCSRHKT